MRTGAKRKRSLGEWVGMICLDCGAKFDEMDQTRSEYWDGRCPRCGSEEINEDGEDSDS